MYEINRANPAVAKMTKRQLLWLIPLFGVAALIWANQTGRFNSGVSANLTAQSISRRVVPMPVNVQKINHVDSFIQSRSYTGTIRAKHRSALGFELSGTVIDVFVDEGDAVDKGQILATLDTETLLAKQNAVEASLAQAKSILAELEAGPRQETIDAARASAEASKSRLDIAELNMKRRNRLRVGGAISAEEYDQAVYLERTARANFESAQIQLAELHAGTRQEKIDAQEAAVRQLEASRREFDVALSKCNLIAPFDGTITRRYLDPGSIAQSSAPIVRLVEHDNLEAWIGLPVSIASGMNVGDKQTILVEAVTFPAIVSAKIRELDTVTRTQTVLLALKGGAATDLVSGQLCAIHVETMVSASGFWIPTSSLSKGLRGLWSVMVVAPQDDGYCAERRDIEIVHTAAGRVLARGTISQDDLIIVDGIHRIADGQMVSPNPVK